MFLTDTPQGVASELVAAELVSAADMVTGEGVVEGVRVLGYAWEHEGVAMDGDRGGDMVTCEGGG